MKGFLVHAAMIGALTAPATQAAASTPEPARPDAVVTEGEGAGGRSVRLASAAAATFLFVPGAEQSSYIVPVAEGGEGGEGRKGRRWRQRNPYYGAYPGRRYEYRRGYREYQGYSTRRYYERPSSYYYYRPY